MRHVTLVVLGSLLVAATPAPTQSGGGWPAWERRVEGVRGAILALNINQLDAYCSGLKDTLHHSGFKFPAWAMAAREGCSMVRNVMEGDNGNRSRRRTICRELKRNGNALLKARDGEGIPRSAPPRARQLGQLLLDVRNAACFGKMPK